MPDDKGPLTVTTEKNITTLFTLTLILIKASKVADGMLLCESRLGGILACMGLQRHGLFILKLLKIKNVTL